MASLAAISTIAGIAGGVVSAVGTIAAGQSQKRAAERQAQQLEMRGKEERAAAQREAFDVGREKGLIQSRQQAVAAASGAGALDPTILDLAGDVEAEGTYRQLLHTYGGEERRKGNFAQAAGARRSGRAAATGAWLDAGGTILGGASTMFDRFGGGRPGGAGFRYG